MRDAAHLHTALFEKLRAELVGYATRLVVRHEVAEELVQEAAVRLLETDDLPPDNEHIRRWIFRVVTNLAIDHLRRHSTWRELVLIDARERAEGDAGFVAESVGLRGSPELEAIAREHLDLPCVRLAQPAAAAGCNAVAQRGARFLVG